MSDISKQLEGCRIIVTRPEDQARMTGAILANMGANVVLASVIRHERLIGEDSEAMLSTLGNLSGTGWLILPSPMAVQTLIDGMEAAELGPEALDEVRIAVIGRTSAAHLRHWGREADFQPSEPTGASLASSLPAETEALVLVAGALETRPELLDGLRARDLRVAHWPLYATYPWVEGLGIVHDALRRQEQETAIMLLVTSPTAVDALANAFEGEETRLEEAGWIAIGPTTYRRIFERGLAPAQSIVCKTPYPDAIVQAAMRLKARFEGGTGHGS